MKGITPPEGSVEAVLLIQAAKREQALLAEAARLSAALDVMTERAEKAERERDSSRQVEACVKAFHDLVVKERDFERTRANRLEQERDTLRTRLAEVERERDDYRTRKDEAYTERNRVVALIARLVLAVGGRAGKLKHEPDPDPTWDPEWLTLVAIDLPTGQVSWHFHDSDAHLVTDLPEYRGSWDGHDTPEKYRRVAACTSLPDDRLAALEAAMPEDVVMEHVKEALRSLGRLDHRTVAWLTRLDAARKEVR